VFCATHSETVHTSVYISVFKVVMHFVTQGVSDLIRSQEKKTSLEHTKENRFQVSLEREEWTVFQL
jgi:hypothetical protein